MFPKWRRQRGGKGRLGPGWRVSASSLWLLPPAPCGGPRGPRRLLFPPGRCRPVRVATPARRDHRTLPLLRDGHPPQAEGAWAPPRRQGPHGVSRAQWPESARRAGRRCKGVGERAASPGARAVSRCLGAGDAESRGRVAGPRALCGRSHSPGGHSPIREACSWQRGSQCPQSPRGTVDITSHLQHPPFRAE